MKERVNSQMDLADFMQGELDKPKSSIRKVAKWLHIAPTTVAKIAKRQIQTMPEVDTLQRIADNSGMSLALVVEMAGAMMGDTEKYAQIARELEAHPWIVEEWKYLTSITREQFKEAVDYIEWRRRHPHPSDDDQSNP